MNIVISRRVGGKHHLYISRIRRIGDVWWQITHVLTSINIDIINIKGGQDMRNMLLICNTSKRKSGQKCKKSELFDPQNPIRSSETEIFFCLNNTDKYALINTHISEFG